MQTRHTIYKSELNGNFSGSKDSLAQKVEKKFEEHSQIDKRRAAAVMAYILFTPDLSISDSL